MTDDLLRTAAQTDAERDAELENRFRPLLEKERAELEDSIAAMGDTSRTSEPSDSPGVAQFGLRKPEAASKEALRRRQYRLLRVKRTLTRMAEGEFGYCTECGEPISLGKLSADPTHHECSTCAATDRRSARR